MKNELMLMRKKGMSGPFLSKHAGVKGLSKSAGSFISSSASGPSYDELINDLIPVGYWKLDETSGTVATDETGGNNLNYRNSPTLSVASLIPSDTSGKSVTFNGTNQDAYKSVVGFRSSDSLGSIVAFIKTTNTASNNYILTSAQDTAANILSFYTHINLGGVLRVYSHNGTGTYIQGTANVCDGQPHMVAVVSNGSSWKLYVDGVEDTISLVSGSNSGNWFADVANRNNILIGGYSNISNGYFNGTIDSVAIFNSELTQQNITDLFNASGL